MQLINEEQESRTISHVCLFRLLSLSLFSRPRVLGARTHQLPRHSETEIERARGRARIQVTGGS